jgi:hypothetical protein
MRPDVGKIRPATMDLWLSRQQQTSVVTAGRSPEYL